MLLLIHDIVFMEENLSYYYYAMIRQFGKCLI
ncbi:hypothetical protein EDC14_102254 [Hydrogenispora ethanolica]|uniref:Uncharacterized protein n=1 Tax=Hydrogenispora ethanolica TaxID=1082276 RepID=A0A4R1RBJ2_HYDET|nr:hypothetical protein EDC14_102254 [Hydrogenispora ethanolica]